MLGKMEHDGTFLPSWQKRNACLLGRAPVSPIRVSCSAVLLVSVLRALRPLAQRTADTVEGQMYTGFISLILVKKNKKTL